MKVLAASVAVLALLATPAEAGLRLDGDAKPRHAVWVQQASANVPIPNARVTIWSGYDPQYLHSLRELYLPKPGHGGWTLSDERVLFLHELGHVYDFHHLSRAERNQFRAAIGTKCGWWSKRCYLPGYPRRAEYNVPPGEMFAEMYAACALGMTRAQVDAIPAPSYGWHPPADTDAALCDLIGKPRDLIGKPRAAYLSR